MSDMPAAWRDFVDWWGTEFWPKVEWAIDLLGTAFSGMLDKIDDFFKYMEKIVTYEPDKMRDAADIWVHGDTHSTIKSAAGEVNNARDKLKNLWTGESWEAAERKHDRAHAALVHDSGYGDEAVWKGEYYRFPIVADGLKAMADELEWSILDVISSIVAAVGTAGSVIGITLASVAAAVASIVGLIVSFVGAALIIFQRQYEWFVAQNVFLEDVAGMSGVEPNYVPPDMVDTSGVTESGEPTGPGQTGL